MICKKNSAVFLSMNRPINQPAERLTNQLENNLERKGEFIFIILPSKSYKHLTFPKLTSLLSCATLWLRYRY